MARTRLSILGLVLPPVVLAFWLWLAGSYSWPRDVVVISAVTLALAAIVLKRKRSTGVTGSVSTALMAGITAPVAFTWLMACWIAASSADAVFRPAAVPLRGSVAVPPASRPALARLRIGIALSGGGYRAALVHAGVLQELATLGIPIANIASVSGGSIIAAFVARGGDPADFVDAVKAGRFRFKRELLSAFALPRWILPLGHYSRRDVQASLVRHVLLANDPAAIVRPSLLLATTDLVHGLSIGVTERGMMFVGPTTERFFRFSDAIEVSELGDQADVVAVSGAFPGAFPALHTSARLTLVPEPLDHTRDARTLPLVLVDGGVRDNLGLKLLQGINREARGAGRNSLSWPGFKPGAEWALDVVIVSDGGESFGVADHRLGLLAQVWRAIGISGLETGILRPIELSNDPPIIPLSIASEIGLSPDAVIVQSATRPRTATRRDTFPARPPDDPALARLAELIPTRDKARQVLIDYNRTRDASPMNVTDLDQRCRQSIDQDKPECHWRMLADLILDDIDDIVGIFRRSATLEDQYSGAEADALVRLGRYFVLLKLTDIEHALEQKVQP